ncbi:hypothetical protein vseg_005454 [Gypsophila vaccaria]
MKINVLTVDKLLTTVDVNPNDLVEDVKALLEIEREVLLYDGKEMKSNDKLSEFGVKEGDLIEIVCNSANNSSSSTTELGLDPDGSAVNPEAFQQELGHNSKMVAELAQGITNSEYVPGNDGDVSLAVSEEKEIISHLLDEERYSEQGPVRGNNDVNEEVIQSNGGSTRAEENDDDDDDGHHHALNASDKESSIASIQIEGSGDLNESNHFTSHEHADADILANRSKGEEIRNPELLDSSSAPNPPQVTSKGRGLKKWRRLRREVSRDPISNPDSTKVLKRGSANILDVKKPNDGSVSSTNAFATGPGHADLFSSPAQSSDYKLPLVTTFSAGADDSEDRSSKSSTAASVPKFRHDVTKPAAHHQREKHRVKNVSGRHSNSSGQRQLGKGHGQTDTSKKPRGESINEEGENSLSSMESDSRSYSTAFLRGSSSVNSDRVQSGRSANYDEEDAYDQQTSEVQSSKELQDGHSKNGEVSPDGSAELSCGANNGKSKDHQVSRDCEPLLNSILMLQSAQEALEREVQMFKEIGKGVNSLCDNSSKATGMFVGPEDGADRSYVQTLEIELNEAQVRLKEKDIKVIELENTIKTMDEESSPQADGRNTMDMQHNLWKAMQTELETLFKLKVEAEVQYVAMMGSRKDLGTFFEDQIKLLKDQKYESSRASISDAGNKGSISQGQTKLDNLHTKITEDEEFQTIQNRYVKYRSYLFVQSLLLILVVGLFLLRVLPKSATVVPT